MKFLNLIILNKKEFAIERYFDKIDITLYTIMLDYKKNKWSWTINISNKDFDAFEWWKDNIENIDIPNFNSKEFKSYLLRYDVFLESLLRLKKFELMETILILKENVKILFKEFN